MRKAIFYVVAIFVFVNGAFVSQASAADPPDLTNKDSGWEFQVSTDVMLNTDAGHGETYRLYLELKAVDKYYTNDTTKETANLLEYNGEPIAMIYGGADGLFVAIRVSDRWFPTNKPAGVEALVISIVWGGSNKPVGLKFTLDTTAGPKERLVSLK